MGRHSKRSVNTMFDNALSLHEGENISQLKAEIAELQSLSNSSFETPVANIVPLQLPGNLKQPRLYFDPSKMERLKDSIGKHGVLEPILVRPGLQDNFEIISGERRWRCCRELGLETIPCVIRQMTDSVALEAALVAHLLNEEISPIEQSESILGLLSLRLELPLEQVKSSLYQIKNTRTRGSAENSRIFSDDELELVNAILGEFGMKLSSFVSNRLPMLNLEPLILAAVREGKLSPTNAVLINRQASELHEELIIKAQGLTKSELLILIRSLGAVDEKSENDITLSDDIYARLKVVRRKPELLQTPKVTTRLKKIDTLLKEIEELCQ